MWRGHNRVVQDTNRLVGFSSATVFVSGKRHVGSVSKVDDRTANMFF